MTNTSFQIGPFTGEEEIETIEKPKRKSLVLKDICPHCNKTFAMVSSFDITNKDTGQVTHILKGLCGHTIIKKGAIKANYSAHESIDGRSPYPFQVKGMEFMEDANFRVLCADEMGLGKTIQSIIPLKYHKDTLLPAAIFCKAKLTRQMAEETARWLGFDYIPQIITSGKDVIYGMPVTIFSLDVLRNFAIEKFEKAEFKTVIIDECQHIKNPDSQRTMQVRRMCRDIDHVIALSGTPFKNRASEYFTILNLLRPDKFPSFHTFQYQYLDYYSTNYGSKDRGLRNPKGFERATKDFIIRRLREDVMPDLPKVDRKLFYVDLEKKEAKEYERESVAFNAFYEKACAEGVEDDAATQVNLLARIAKLKHICGRSKVTDCFDFATDFLMTTDKKLAIFVHHQDVGSELNNRLTRWCNEFHFEPPLILTGGMTADKCYDVTQEFKKPGVNRILIASTLASGEGLNLQYQCCDCVILERQWNPANEEQVEARFTRPDSINMGGYVSSTYMLAGGTIDEWLTQLVEAKRIIFQSVMDGKVADSAGSLQSELIDIVLKKNRERWAL